MCTSWRARIGSDYESCNAQETQYPESDQIVVPSCHWRGVFLRYKHRVSRVEGRIVERGEYGVKHQDGMSIQNCNVPENMSSTSCKLMQPDAIPLQF